MRLLIGLPLDRRRSTSPRRSGSPTCSPTGRAERRRSREKPAPTPTRSTGSCARWPRSASSQRTTSARFALTPLGEPLRTDVPGSLHGWARSSAGRTSGSAWGNLEHSVRTGENSFRALHGTDVWDWRAARPEESAIFDGAMSR